jgi:hypothetical protein
MHWLVTLLALAPAAVFADPSFLVAPIQLYGLSNRLRTLEFAHMLASASNRVLAVHWMATTDCNVMFSDLFDVAAMQQSGLLLDVSRDNGLSLRFVPDSSHVFRLQANTNVARVRLLNMWDMRPLIEDLTVARDHYALEAWWISRPAHLDCQTYLTHRSRFLRALKPVPWIARAVDTFVADRFGFGLVFGVHIRFDREFDTPDIPSSFEATSPLQRYVVVRMI